MKNCRQATDCNPPRKEDPSLRLGRLRDFLADTTSTTATYHTHGNNTEKAAVNAAKKDVAGNLNTFNQNFDLDVESSEKGGS